MRVGCSAACADEQSIRQESMKRQLAEQFSLSSQESHSEKQVALAEESVVYQ